MATAMKHAGLTSRRKDGSPVPVSSEYKVIRRRSYFPWVLAGLAAALTVGFLWLLISNPALDWNQTLNYLFAPQIIRGVWTTIQLSVLSMLLGVVLGVGIGLGRMSHNKVLRTLSAIYVTVFRGVPVLLQLLIWGNIGLIVRNISLGIPFTDISFFSVPTNEVVGPFTAAIVGLALAEAAYIAEVVRAGVLSVDRGQLEAASALGMTPGRTTRRIMLPQALRLIIPPMGNQFVTLIKATSLVSVIAGGDLLTQVQNISATNYRVIEMLAVAAFWYLVLVSVATIGQYFLERAVSKGIQA
jgi:polar amino acid transport system permease protein